MNRLFKKAFIVPVLMLGCITLWGCPARSVTGNTNITMGDLEISIGQISREGLVYEYLWDGSDEGRIIEIPDVTDRDEKITELGGRANMGVPAYFGITLKPLDYGFQEWTGPYGRPLEEGTSAYEEAKAARKEYMEQNPLYGKIVTYKGDDETLYDAPISFDELVFTIRLGKYINSIMLDSVIDGSDYVGFRQDDGSIVFYAPVYYFECDEENETFYAEDGTLYLKETGEEANLGLD